MESFFTFALYHRFLIYNSHSVRVYRHSHSARQLLHRFVFPADDFFHIKCRSTLYRDTVFRRTLDTVQHLSGIKQGFGRNTSFIKTHTAHCFFLEQNSTQTVSSCSLGSSIPGRSTTDNSYIISHNRIFFLVIHMINNKKR